MLIILQPFSVSNQRSWPEWRQRVETSEALGSAPVLLHGMGVSVSVGGPVVGRIDQYGQNQMKQESLGKKQVEENVQPMLSFWFLCVMLYLTVRATNILKQIESNNMILKPAIGCKFLYGYFYMGWHDDQFQKCCNQQLLHPAEPPIPEWGSHQNSSPKGRETSQHGWCFLFPLLEYDPSVYLFCLFIDVFDVLLLVEDLHVE